MTRTCVDTNPPSVVEKDDRWALVLRASSSRQFSKAPQLRDIFVYLCQRAIADPAAVIKEHEIGCNVLGRKPDFNPNEDNIVRVQISHLRKKLEEYFASDGKDEPVQITIPKGSYLPRFAPKPQEPQLPAAKSRTVALPVLAAVACVLALACVYLLLRPLSPPGPGHRTAGQDPFWSRIFGGAQPAAIVVSDTCMVTLQDVLDDDVTVADYAGGRYQENALNNITDAKLKSALELVASRQYTSLADLNLSSKLIDLSRQFGANQASIRYARHLNVRDFKAGNFIFLGSRRGIPWERLFEPQLNFAMEQDKQTRRFFFRNKAPRPGEQPKYVPIEKSGVLETYSDIALLPNLGNNGAVLILSGLTMADTEAAGELLSRKDIFSELSRILGSEVVRDRYFEILLKTRAVAGAAESSHVVTFRVIQPGAVNN